MKKKRRTATRSNLQVLQRSIPFLYHGINSHFRATKKDNSLIMNSMLDENSMCLV